MLKKFDERAFLIVALVGIFFMQFLTVGYQFFSCQNSLQTSKDSDKVTLVCNNASNSLGDAAKLAIATFLALLVPPASPPGSYNKEVKGTRRKKNSSDSEDGNEVG